MPCRPSAIILGLYLLTSSVACSNPSIGTQLSESQAHDVLRVLYSYNIPAVKETIANQNGKSPRFRITLPKAHMPRAIELLHAHAMPRTPQPGFDDLLDTSRLIPGVNEDKIRYITAVAGELAETLETIEGVISARVHIAPVQQEALPLDTTTQAQPRASVFIKYAQGNKRFDQEQVKSMVVGAVQDLRKEHISVVSIPSRLAQSKAFPSLLNLGPLATTASSMPVLKLTLGGLLGLNILLGAALLWMIRKRGQKQDISTQGVTGKTPSGSVSKPT